MTAQGSALKDKIQEAVKTAMRAQDKERLSVIRLITSALKQVEVDERVELDDARVLAILDKMLKQRRESIAQFQAANRNDLVEKEQAEIKIIETFMPEPLGEAEIETAIQSAMQSVGAKSVKDMGAVMAILKPILQGRTDLSVVSKRVQQCLGAM